MLSSLNNHKSCCRCCSKLLKTGQKTVEITRSIQKRFLNLTEIELITSDRYSNFICESCNSKLTELCDFKNELIEYQTKLYTIMEPEDEAADEEENDSIMTHDDNNEIEEVIITVKPEAFEEEEQVPINIDVSYHPHEIIQNIKQEKHCDLCNQTFSANSFYHHMLRKHHNKEQRFTCDIDGKSYSLKSDLKSHMKCHLSKDLREKYFCPTCDAPFLSLSSLTHHQNFFHSGYIEIHPCECGQQFSSRMKLLQHMKTHSAHQVGAFQCKTCQRTYLSLQSLNKHMKTHKSNKEPCHICDKLFLPGPSMKSHLKTHSHALFNCHYENCGKSFQSKSSLNNHLKLHQSSSSSSFQCPECASCFASQIYLNKHQQRQHTSVRLQCEAPNCVVSFKRKDKLIEHLRNHKNLNEDIKNLLIANVKTLKILSW